MKASVTGVWIYVLMFLHTYSQNLAESSLSIEPNRPLFIMEHSPMELECVHRGENGHVKWTKDGHEVNEAHFEVLTFRTAAFTQGQVQLITKMTIKRNDMVLSDSGQYACVSGSLLKAMRVKVLRVLTDSRVITDPGGSITLRCDPSTHDVNVFWTKNRTRLAKLPHLAGRVTLENGNTTLRIRNASLADTGQYVCHMEPRDGVIQGNLTMPVVLSGSPYFPDGHINKTETVTTSKQRLELRCPVQGYPIPEVVWWAEGEKLNSSESVKLIPSDGVSSAILRIEGYFPEIGEHFVCEASNQQGRTRRHFQIQFVNSAQRVCSSFLSVICLLSLTVIFGFKSIIL